MHEVIRSFSCKYCRVSFSSRREMENHKATHVDLDSVKCHFCNAVLESEEKLAIHKEMHTPVQKSGM